MASINNTPETTKAMPFGNLTDSAFAEAFARLQNAMVLSAARDYCNIWSENLNDSDKRKLSAIKKELMTIGTANAEKMIAALESNPERVQVMLGKEVY